jgi:hypothetical protein
MRLFFTYLALIISWVAFSQRIQNVSLSLVNSQNQGTNSQVLVHFEISPGQSCPGWEILHCTDSLNYISVYNNAGICGNQSTSESKDYTHPSPGLEMLNYYKVSIPGFETSKPYRIYVGQQVPKPNLLVYPNPVFNQSFITLKYMNYSGSTVFGYIYNQFGTPVRELLLKVDQSLSSVNISDLADGLYVVWVTDGAWLFRSKFIVKRT